MDNQNFDKINGNAPLKAVTKRRSRVPNKPDVSLSLWSVIKNCIGKDLTRIALPINFNEPLSMLQKATEDYEYSELLNKAIKCKDIVEQLSYVAAFTITAYSTTSERVAKPFNPLLGETYECDRLNDLGWRCISEQVSHHPPILAQYCESKEGWTAWQEFQLTSSFTFKSINAIPKGMSRVDFPKVGISYSYNRPMTSCHNLIIGKLYVEHSGEVTITGEGKAVGWKCRLTYQSHSFFSKDHRQVKGQIIDPSNNVKMILTGRWDEQIEIAPVLSNDGNKFKTGPAIVIWQKRPPPQDSYLYYNFTTFACQLNEMEYGIAPTDSRFRPDQRFMEDGDWDASNCDKVRLEELQRERRKLGQDVRPIWFSCRQDGTTDGTFYQYNGHYWESKSNQDFSQCPSIF